MLGKLPILFHPSGPSGLRHLIHRKTLNSPIKIGVRSWPDAVSSGESGFRWPAVYVITECIPSWTS